MVLRFIHGSKYGLVFSHDPMTIPQSHDVQQEALGAILDARTGRGGRDGHAYPSKTSIRNVEELAILSVNHCCVSKDSLE